MAEGKPPAKLKGTDRAAVLLLSLGEENAAEVLRHMGPKEVQKVGSAMAAMMREKRSSLITTCPSSNASAGTQMSNSETMASRFT